MAETESKNSETMPDSTENGLMATKEVGSNQSAEAREATSDSKEAVELNKNEVINEPRKSTEEKSPKKCDKVDDTVQSSTLQSSTGDEPTVTETTPMQSSLDKTKTPVKSSEEKKSPVKSVDDKESPSKTSQSCVETKESPKKSLVEKMSPEKSPSKPDEKKSPAKADEKKSPSKAAEEKSPSKVTEKKSPDQTLMEADSSEVGSSSKTDDVSDDDKVKEHLKLLGEGKKAFANNDFLSAADYFGRAAELSRTVYGEFSEKNGETLYLYGATMLECWKNDNTVLGENMKGKDEDEGYDDEEDDDDDEEGGEEGEDDNAEAEEKMETEESEAPDTKINGDAPQAEKEIAGGDVKNGEVKENGHDQKLNGDAEEIDVTEQNGEEPSSSNAEEKTDDKEDEDNYLKVAWEMLDLAKIIYHKVDDKKRLADTYMKLGEVAVESGHETATEEMKKCLDLRQLFLEPHDRVIAETHFNIGVAFSVFKLFDEATKHFEKAKEILQNKMKVLKDLNTEESLKEFAEIESIIPELGEKIQDMADSKRDEASKAAGEDSNGCSSSSAAAPADSKPASNISHLVKRKRKMEDIIAEKSTKVCRVEVDETKTSSENSGSKD